MDFDDIFEFVMERILGPFMVVLIVLFIGFCCVGVFFIPSCIREDREREKQIEECYKQEPRTKDCEYLLWKYELKQRQPRNTTTAVPVIVPMVH